MSQFASTLYPQTNPTNPILLSLRSSMLYTEDRISIINEYVWYLTEHPTGYSGSHVDHALRVLSRLAPLTG